jgi:hypothetical protein
VPWREKGRIVGSKCAFELSEFLAILAEKINARRVNPVGFQRGIGHRKEKKNSCMGHCGQNESGREQEVYAVAVGPLEEQCGGFHFSSDVATTVG